MIRLLTVLALVGASQPVPRLPQESPRRHQVQFASSDDGLEFAATEAPIMLRASAPDVLELTDAGGSGEKGWVVVYAVDARSHSGPGTERLCRLVSRDAGKTWGEPEPVTVTGVSGGVPVDSAAVQLPDGRVRLYYAIQSGTAGRGPGEPGRPPPGPFIPTEPPRPGSPQPPLPAGPRPSQAWPVTVGSALSDDGRNFKAEEGVRLQATGLSDPEVVYWRGDGDGGGGGGGAQWLMFLLEHDRMILARSRDGLRFERDGVFGLPAESGNGPAAVVLLDGRVRVFHAAGPEIRSTAYNPRSQRWEAEGGVRARGADPSVAARETGGYVMVFRREMSATVP